MLPMWGAVSSTDDPEIKTVRRITLRDFTAVSRKPSLIAAPVGRGIFTDFLLDNVSIKLTGTPEELSRYRWPFEETGVLDLYRFPELDVQGFHAESDTGLPAVLRRG